MIDFRKWDLKYELMILLFNICTDGVVVEEGAEWINGGPRNLLYDIATELGVLSPLRPDNQWGLYLQVWYLDNLLILDQ